MRHALWTLVVVTLMSAASQAIAQNWKEHRPEGADYVVEMPGEPKINSQCLRRTRRSWTRTRRCR